MYAIAPLRFTLTIQLRSDVVTIMPFEFNCADCGQLWEFKRKTQGSHRCRDCAEKARKEGRGSIQLAGAILYGIIDYGIVLVAAQERSGSAPHKDEPIDLEAPDTGPSGIPKDVRSIWRLAYQNAMEDPRISKIFRVSSIKPISNILATRRLILS